MMIFGWRWLPVLGLMICSIVVASGFATTKQRTPHSPEDQEQQALSLERDLNNSFVHSGKVSAINANINGCILEIQTEYQRPCNEEFKGEFILRRVEIIDLNELDSDPKNIDISPFSTASQDLIYWGFSKGKTTKMRTLNDQLSTNANVYFQSGVNGGERAELLTKQAEKIFEDLELNSRVVTHSCLEAPAISGFRSEQLSLWMTPAKTNRIISSLNEYQRNYCAVN